MLLSSGFKLQAMYWKDKTLLYSVVLWLWVPKRNASSILMRSFWCFWSGPLQIVTPPLRRVFSFCWCSQPPYTSLIHSWITIFTSPKQLVKFLNGSVSPFFGIFINFSGLLILILKIILYNTGLLKIGKQLISIQIVLVGFV